MDRMVPNCRKPTNPALYVKQKAKESQWKDWKKIESGSEFCGAWI